MLASTDWRVLEAGLKQRMRLLDLVLKDIYGPGHLMRSRVMPPQLVYGNAAFLRAAVRSFDTEQAALRVYAADVVRDSEGNFRVCRDRTQLPAGAGLALEARIVGSRLLHNLIRGSHVHRQAGFLNTLRANLEAIAPNSKLSPQVVVLGAGEVDANHFDQAYLANYLGFTLVEGEDLTVREGHLWLKTIEGLKLVDVVLRRVRDAECDPLELQPDSLFGVPGMLEAGRRGNVLLAASDTVFGCAGESGIAAVPAGDCPQIPRRNAAAGVAAVLLVWSGRWAGSGSGRVRRGAGLPHRHR